MADYTISEEYGLTVVRGSVPVTLLEEFFPEDGRSVKEVAMDLQAALDATLVIGTPDAIEKARKELGVSHEPPQEIRYLPPSQQLAAWRHRGNVGTSSRALSCVLAGEPLPDDAPSTHPTTQPTSNGACYSCAGCRHSANTSVPLNGSPLPGAWSLMPGANSRSCWNKVTTADC